MPLLSLLALLVQQPDALEAGFQTPPPAARTRAYWWWLNGNVTKASIKRDLTEMAAKGFGGAVIVDAGGAEQRGNAQVPHGPTFGTPAWRELFQYTLVEADRLGLELSLNIQSGWNLGGPMVKPADAPKKLVWSEAVVEPGMNIVLPEPRHAADLYGEVAVLAYPVPKEYQAGRRATLSDWEQKALIKPLSFSAPPTAMLVTDGPDKPGEAATLATRVLDVTSKLRPDGSLDWSPAVGRWEVVRIGYTLNDYSRVSTNSEGWDGYALDPFDRGAFDRYWKQVVDPLLDDAKAHPSLRYLHTDSWEVEVANWTPTLFEEFKKRRGYDLRPYLPTLLGRIVDSRSTSNRVLADLRRTMGDLAIDNHYRPFRDYAHRRKLLIHPESGGPHAVPIDSLQCLGYNDAPMSEFWASATTHRVKEEDRFFVKQPASAAHTYGRDLVLAEGFTTIGPHWQETLWDNLKPNFDEAACQGMNRLVWHAFVNSPESEGIPGQQYFAGTHLNPNVTWWSRSRPVFDYFNRVQFMLQQGRFVADVLAYYGDHVPNFAQLQKSDPGGALPGYDYDAATMENVLALRVKNGRLVLPSGMSYRVLTLPDRETIALPVLRKVRELVRAGATVIGRRPVRAAAFDPTGRQDAEVARLAKELWDSGRVLNPQPAREVLMRQGVGPDFSTNAAFATNFIHRTLPNGDLYFVTNRTASAATPELSFRVTGKRPELWDATSGEIRPVTDWRVENGRTVVPVAFRPYGSWFVVFREAGTPPATARPNEPSFREVSELTGEWEVRFDPRWGGPASVTFPSLTDWTRHDDPAIRFYSGTATYVKRFPRPTGGRVWLDLGQLRELGEVRLNGKNLGVLWAPPFRVEITDALRDGENLLEVDVVNFWPNRIIGDQTLGTKFTKTNVRQITAKTALMPSGLFGPVRFVVQ